MLSALLVAAGLGCGGSDPAGEQTSPEGGGKDTANHTKADDPKETVEAVRTALAGLRDGEPDRLWGLLPESYRDDLETVVHRFAERIPAESWARTVRSVRRTVDLLRERKAWFLSHPFLARVPTLDDPREAALDPKNVLHDNWDGMLAVVSTLVDGELGEHAKVRALDGEAFLRGTGRTTCQRLYDLAGPEFAESFRTDLDKVVVEPVSRDGGTAVVRIGGAGYEEVEHEFRRVGERWIPVSLAEGWEANVASLPARIDGWSFDAEAWSARLDHWDATLADLEAAETEAALHARIDEWLAEFAPANARPPEPTPVPEDAVTVVFAGKLDLATVDAVQTVLNGAAADPDLAVSIDAIVGGTTVFTVSHAGPVDRFVERIGADARVTVDEIDGPERRITARWSPTTEEP